MILRRGIYSQHQEPQNRVLNNEVLRIFSNDVNSYSGSGSTVFDVSLYGNTNNMTIANFPWNSGTELFESNGSSSNMYRNDAGSNEDWNINKTGQISIEYIAEYDSLTRSLDGGWTYGDLFGGSTNNSYQWDFGKSGSTLYFRVQTGGTNYGISINTSTIILGQLNHILATYSTLNGSMKVYINGALAGQNTTPTGLNFPIPLFRKKLTQSREGQYCFLGDLQTLGIYNKELTEEEVTQNYNALISQEQENDALHFDANYNEWVQLPLNFITNTRALSFWVKPDVTTFNGQARQFLAGQYGGSNQRTFYAEFRDTGVIRMYLPTSTTGNNYTIIESNAGQYFNGGQWYYISISLDATTGGTMYVDGVAQTNTAPTATLGFTRSGSNFYFGGFGPVISTLGNTGTQKELAVWTTARTQSEIVSDMTRVYTGAESGLKAYFPTNEGSGNTIQDINSVYTGTIVTTNTTQNYIDDVMWVNS